jgi:hypothetical protein
LAQHLKRTLATPAPMRRQSEKSEIGSWRPVTSVMPNPAQASEGSVPVTLHFHAEFMAGIKCYEYNEIWIRQRLNRVKVI